MTMHLRSDGLTDSSGLISYIVLSGLIFLVSLFWGWIYAIEQYGFFLGFAFGWIPAAIIGLLLGIGWPIWLLFHFILFMTLFGSKVFGLEFGSKLAHWFFWNMPELYRIYSYSIFKQFLE